MALKLSMLNFFSPPGEVVKLVALCEELQVYERFWIGEHHTAYQVADPLTVALLAAGSTERIRVGTGAVSMTFRNPYIVAESAFLAELFVPGRIDLGVTRAAATKDQVRPFLVADLDTEAVYRSYETRLRLLRRLLGRELEEPVPMLESDVEYGPPLFLMGIGRERAQLAAELGAGFCSSFHHGGTVDVIREALESYAERFIGSPSLR